MTTSKKDRGEKLKRDEFYKKSNRYKYSNY